MKSQKKKAGPPLALNSWSDEDPGNKAGSVFENSLVAVRAFIMHNVSANMDASDTVLPPVFVITSTEGASTPTCNSPSGLQEGLVWHPWRLIDQDIQSFFKDPGLRKLDLGLLLFGGIDNGSAANLGNLAALPIE